MQNYTFYPLWLLAAIYRNFLSQNNDANLQNFNITFKMSSGIKKLIQNSMTFKISTQKSHAWEILFEELLYHRILSMWGQNIGLKFMHVFLWSIEMTGKGYDFNTLTTTMYLSFTDMTTFFANDLAIHKNKTDQYQMFWSVLPLDNHHHSTAWLKAQMISEKLLNSLFNSLLIYLSHVKPNGAQYYTS